MTLYEVELLMRELSKTVPETAHILFGAAVDDSMGDSLSVTIISSLPEEKVILKEEADKEEAKTEAKVETKVQMKPEAAIVAPEAPSYPEPTEEKQEDISQEEDVIEQQDDEIEDEEVEVEEEEESIEEEQPEETSRVPELKIIDEDPEQEEMEVADEPEEAEEEKPTSPPRKEERSRFKPSTSPQGELLLDGGPRGKFEGEEPNLFDGEDLDIPAFLRKKK
jgi:cell division GTPase FtsZ